MPFRYDINALRAVAVLLVMLFHFDVAAFGGGFVGVDVFFVISGFLMTGIIVGGLDREFSLVGFYQARIVRIVPALVFLVFVVLIAGYFFIAPGDYEELARHAIGAAGFYSNHIFADESGYFDTPSHFKWLLHSWSLAVEWQFYLVYPLLMMALYKWLRRHFVAVLVTLMVGSFVLSVFLSLTKPEFAFFSLPTRFWELSFGGLVYFLVQRGVPDALRFVRSKFVESLGLALIVSAAFLYSGQSPWPYYGALMPVLGTGLVLLAAGQSKSVWIDNPVTQALGRWSYSIYLWHWPIIVFLLYRFAEVTPVLLVAGFAVSVLCGFLSYRCIELPAKNFFKSRKARLVFGFYAVTLVVVIGIAMLIKTSDGAAYRFVDNERLMLAQAGKDRAMPKQRGADGGRCGFDRDTATLEPCIIGDEVEISFIVLGDSHAGSIAGAVLDSYRQRSSDGLAAGYLLAHQCPTIFGAELKFKNRNNNCGAFYRQVFELIKESPQGVRLYIVNRYAATLYGANEKSDIVFGVRYDDAVLDGLPPEEAYAQEFTKTLCVFGDLRSTSLFAPIPEIGVDVPATLIRRAVFDLPGEEVVLPRQDYVARTGLVSGILEVASEQCGVTYIDTADTFCDADSCYASEGGRPLYLDDDHLNKAGRDKLIPLLNALR